MNANDFIDGVLSLHLPSKDYIVIGSGILCALGIREAADIDLVVSENVFAQIKGRSDWTYITDHRGEHLTFGAFELWLSWDSGTTTPNLQALKKDEIIIENVPFTSLNRLYEWKRQKNRPKDQKDIQLIDIYLRKQVETIGDDIL